MNNASHHLAFNCHDTAREEAFYARHFGFRRVRVFNAGTTHEFLMLRLGTFCVELFPASHAPVAVPDGAPGFKHVAFEVDDIEAKAAELREAGCDIGAIIDCSGHVPGLKVCFLKDPEGNSIELMENWLDDTALA